MKADETCGERGLLPPIRPGGADEIKHGGGALSQKRNACQTQRRGRTTTPKVPRNGRACRDVRVGLFSYILQKTTSIRMDESLVFTFNFFSFSGASHYDEGVDLVGFNREPFPFFLF